MENIAAPPSLTEFIKHLQDLLQTLDMFEKDMDYKQYTEEIHQKIKEETDRHKKEQEELNKKAHMHSYEEFEELRKQLEKTNEQNLKAIKEMMEKLLAQRENQSS